MKSEELTQLQNYVHEQLKAGVSELTIRETIKKEGGWTDEDLDPLFVKNAVVTPSDSTHFSNSTPPVGWQPSEQQAGTPPVGEGAVNKHVSLVPPAEMAPEGSGEARSATKASGTYKTVVIALLVVVLGGVGAYAGYMAVQSSSLFSSKAPYTEETFISGIVMSLADIRSGTFTFSMQASMEKRDPDARPFVLTQNDELEAFYAAYARDMARVTDVRAISTALNNQATAKNFSSGSSGHMTWAGFEEQSPGTYPETLEDDDMLLSLLTANSTFQYRAVDGGSSYKLTVLFETDEVVRAIIERNSPPWSSKVIARGREITFTPLSSVPFLPQEPKKPFLTEFGEQLKMIPATASGQISLGVTTDIEQDRTKFSIDTEADLGDLSYKLAIDSIKIENDFYFRIRNMPGPFLTMFGLQRDVWIHIPASGQGEEDEYSVYYLDSVIDMLPDLEEVVTESKDAAIAFLRKMLTYADESGMIYFKSPPRKETYNNEDVYRYDIGINKEGFVRFVTKSLQAAEQDRGLSNDFFTPDMSLIEDMQKPHFNEVFDYLTENMGLVLYTDTKGQLVRYVNTLRIVPPDDATLLKDKQWRITLEILFQGINKPVTIEAPSDSKSLKELFGSQEGYPQGLFDF